MTKKQINWVGFLVGILLFSISLFRETLFINSYFGIYTLLFLKSASILVLGYFFARIIGVRPIRFLIVGICFEAFIRLTMPFAGPINDRVKKIYKYPTLKNIIFPITDYAQNIARNIGSDMGSVQYFETGSRYDEELFYTFEPSQFSFKHINFDNEYSINSKGARDDEASLQKPEIIFIGDSFTTGIGVNQDETFSSKVEKALQKKTLNIGVPSYGTARESLFLKRFDLDSCKYIVLQYCNNDDNENKAFVDNNFKLNKRSEKDYKDAQIYNELVLHYYPFRYTYSLFAKKLLYTLADLMAKKTTSQPQAKAVTNDPVINFFKILQGIQATYPEKKIIVFELGLFATSEEFYKELKKLVETHQLKNVELIDTSKFINCDGCYYSLDFHIKPKGHQLMADTLVNYLKK
ncbi:SGNH/GDSL hydrolase family protein [Emticicia agri]|uniref:SGNH/GDSL hydrolase family protein n=1 Tax=Emticicia agri TaxID=2492393 RepID=A0A4V1ZDB7_9BACT|nr:SGNH/GDSL hydrolase family protein [Emticicia agri]RYU95600.1 SGNH/GDSL hydrolase family protein [Emticicia agri]